MKKQFLIILFFLFSGSLFAQSKNMVVIKGTMTGDLKGYNKITIFTRTDRDSTEIIDGKYTFTFPFEGPTLKVIYAQYNQKMSRMYRPFGLLITEPGTYTITSDIEDIYGTAEVAGPSDAVLYRQFQLKQDKGTRKLTQEMIRLYGNSWYMIDEKNPVYEALQMNRDSLSNIYVVSKIEDLIRSHPNSYASAFVLQSSASQIGSLDKKESLLSLLSEDMRESDAGRNFADHIQGVKNSKIGNTVSYFTLPDPEGKDVELSNLKGKYVLIDFWASWCSPCRQSFPHMREFYKKYKNDKFEIYSISIDEDKPSWLKAVKEENNPWLQSWDDKNIAKSQFAVTAIPSTFLIDGEGKIVAKEVGFDSNGGSEIEKILISISENKKPDQEAGSTDGKMIPAIKMN